MTLNSFSKQVPNRKISLNQDRTKRRENILRQATSMGIDNTMFLREKRIKIPDYKPKQGTSISSNEQRLLKRFVFRSGVLF